MMAFKSGLERPVTGVLGLDVTSFSGLAPPQLAELIVSQGDEKILESYRREIVVFCDLRGYTAFTETAEPEEVLDFQGEYHGALGPLVTEFEGTLDHFAGDGIMVFFNDPVPCPDPAECAVNMAVAMREASVH
jgi:class 3 adenylate cyclase